MENENEEAENGEVQFVENGTAPVVNGEVSYSCILITKDLFD